MDNSKGGQSGAQPRDTAGQRTKEQQPDLASGSHQQALAGEGGPRGGQNSEQARTAETSDTPRAGGTTNFQKIDGPTAHREGPDETS